jgi:enoyl-CoA hydratase
MSTVVVTPGDVAIVRIRRVHKANAYDQATLQQLDGAIRTLTGAARVVVVETEGDGAFSGGADLDELRAARPEDARELFSQRVFTSLLRASFVSIAAVHGPAVAGGCELALACDLRVAGPKATFSLPETSLGLIPSAGGTTRLARLVGVGRAKAVILGGAVVDADRALAWGLVDRVVDDPRAEARRWAKEIALRDPSALAAAKSILDRGENDGSLEAEREAEAHLYARRSQE